MLRNKVVKFVEKPGGCELNIMGEGFDEVHEDEAQVKIAALRWAVKMAVSELKREGLTLGNILLGLSIQEKPEGIDLDKALSDRIKSLRKKLEEDQPSNLDMDALRYGLDHGTATSDPRNASANVLDMVVNAAVEKAGAKELEEHPEIEAMMRDPNMTPADFARFLNSLHPEGPQVFSDDFLAKLDAKQKARDELLKRIAEAQKRSSQETTNNEQTPDDEDLRPIEVG
jgi:hypothetical protein